MCTCMIRKKVAGYHQDLSINGSKYPTSLARHLSRGYFASHLAFRGLLSSFSIAARPFPSRILRVNFDRLPTIQVADLSTLQSITSECPWASSSSLTCNESAPGRCSEENLSTIVTSRQHVSLYGDYIGFFDHDGRFVSLGESLEDKLIVLGTQRMHNMGGYSQYMLNVHKKVTKGLNG